MFCLLLSGCEKPEEVSEPLPKVKVSPLAELQIPYGYSAPAQVLSMNDSRLSAELNAAVKTIPAKVGNRVAAGDELVTLDCNDAKNRLEQAKGTLASLKARETLAAQRLQRAEKLRAQRNLAEEDLNLRQSELKAAVSERRAQAAQLAIAERDVQHCVIRAPFNGVVTERYAQVGQLASPGTAMLRIVDTDNLEVSAQITSDDIDSLSTYASPYFEYKDRRYPLQLRAIAPVVDSRTRSQVARFDFTEEKPKPGTAGRLAWQDSRAALPAHFISRRNNTLGVLIANSSTVKFHALPAAKEGQPAFIDLPPETKIITDGRLSLSAGDQVQITE